MLYLDVFDIRYVQRLGGLGNRGQARPHVLSLEAHLLLEPQALQLIATSDGVHKGRHHGCVPVSRLRPVCGV
jgi:hypothetical protein